MEIQSIYYTKGTLLDLVVQRHALKEEQARFFFKAICEAVKFLKEKNICHRDLKLENVLLDDDKNPIVIDFAFAAFNKSDFSETIGTEGY